MDKLGDYLNIAIWLEADLERSASALKALSEELFAPLSAEKAGTVPQTTDSKVLREYIEISRRISKHLFDAAQKHVLTIEHLADHILCRRAYAERQGGRNTKITPATPQISIMEKLEMLTKGMSVEEIENYLKSHS
jgi:hypothetical protein